MLDDSRSKFIFVIATGVRVAEPVLTLHTDLTAGFLLLGLQVVASVRVRQLGVEYAEQVVGHGQVFEGRTGRSQRGQSATRSDIVVVVVWLDAQHALGAKQLACRVGHTVIISSPRIVGLESWARNCRCNRTD